MLTCVLYNRQYKGAESEDLWRNLQQAAEEDNRLPNGITIKTIMDTWTLQSGHPIVRVAAAGPRTVYISQVICLFIQFINLSKKILDFLLEKNVFQERYGDSPDQGLWYVPITVVSADRPTRENWIPDLWLEESDLLKSYSVDTSKWLMINQDAYGYYRVLYDEPLTKLILEQLELDPKVISPLSRSQLVDDYLTVANLGNSSSLLAA
jgi:aminopeptidase N